MTEVVNIENIQLASVNRRTGYNSKTGKHFLSPAYKSFKKEVFFSARKVKIAPPYRVMVELSTAMDADNTLKAVFDALQEAGIIEDDKQVLQLHVYKRVGKRGAPGRLQVFVDTIEGVTV